MDSYRDIDQNQGFPRKQSPSWFFKVALSKFFFCKNGILDIFRTISGCERYSPRHHPEKMPLPPTLFGRHLLIACSVHIQYLCKWKQIACPYCVFTKQTIFLVYLKSITRVRTKRFFSLKTTSKGSDNSGQQKFYQGD